MRKPSLSNVMIGSILALAIAESVGAQVPQGVGEGWLGEFDHASRRTTDKAAVIKFLKESFGAVRSAYQIAERQSKAQLFKKDVTVGDIFLRILVHNHEPMGQAIGYARMNGIAAPWSPARDQ